MLDDMRQQVRIMIEQESKSRERISAASIVKDEDKHILTERTDDGKEKDEY